MINPLEIKIKNWIILNHAPYGKAVKTPVQVECIGLGIPEEQVLDQLWYRGQGVFGSHHDFEDFDPIELSEDILVKAGFEKDYVSKKWRKSGLHGYIEVNHRETFYKCYWIRRTLRSVHQLQNLYFALTGHELTITF